MDVREGAKLKQIYVKYSHVAWMYEHRLAWMYEHRHNTE